MLFMGFSFFAMFEAPQVCEITDLEFIVLINYDVFI